MRTGRTLVLVALAAATACSRFDGRLQRVATPESDELSMAARAVGEYRRHVRPSTDAAAVDRLARVSDALVRAAKAGPAGERAALLPWEIVLVDSPDTTVATFANGTIFVDAGLLRILVTDDALAGALGQSIVRPLMFRGGGSGRHHHNEAMVGIEGGGGGSRADRAERETEAADYAGVTLAVDAGYDPEGVLVCFDQLGLRERGDAAREHLPALRERAAQRIHATTGSDA